MTAKQFRRFQAKCDHVGLLTDIKRIGKGKKRSYEVIINMQLMKTYKTRYSAKKFIVKQYLKNKNA